MWWVSTIVFLITATTVLGSVPTVKSELLLGTKADNLCATLRQFPALHFPPAIIEQICVLAQIAKNFSDSQKNKKQEYPRVFVATRFNVKVVNMTSGDGYTSEILPLPETMLVLSVDYDPVDGVIYWSSMKRIQRAKIDGTESQEIFSDLGDTVDGIAIDWVARNLYWADEKIDSIGVSRLNGSSSKRILKNLNRPRGIALDPAEGKMYWTEWGEPPRIATATLDGKNIKPIVEDSIRWPNGISIDYERRLLYFADAYFDRIEVVNLDGSGRKVLLNEDVAHIYGLNYLDEYLYWTDWEAQKLERMRVDDTSTRETLDTSSGRMFGVKATYLQPSEATNACAEDTGGCSHLCFYTPEGVKCGCPEGEELDATNRTCKA